MATGNAGGSGGSSRSAEGGVRTGETTSRSGKGARGRASRVDLLVGTVKGAFHLRGDPSNDPDPMYVAVADSTGVLSVA